MLVEDGSRCWTRGLVSSTGPVPWLVERESHKAAAKALLLLSWITHLSIPEALVMGPESSASVRTTQHVSSLPPSNPSLSACLHGAFALRRLATVLRISG